MRRPSRLGRAIAGALLAVLAVPIVPAAPAYATGNGRWSVAPTPPRQSSAAPRVYFFLESPPGQTVIDSVRVTNHTDKPLAFQLYPADAFNTVADGGFGLLAADQTQHGIGAWTRLSAGTVVLPAGGSADVAFTVTVPANAPPGDHVGGVVAAEAVPSGRTGAGADVAVRQAVGARLYLRVSGTAVPGLAVSDLTANRRELAYSVANTGNVHLAPAIDIRSSGLFGHAVRHGTPAQLDLIPGARSRLRAALSGVWPVDVVTTTVTLTADGGVRGQASTTTLVGVWPAIGVVIVLVAGTGWLLHRRRRARRLRPRRLA
ncbi:DUF916 domain-containing protein [Hamadaea sp. NPDC051192]|uniref:WxL protein peptidoglycan domain-containing protein n=1 Tax=Hamadaea sp. NPDC051192 TaxID=3154940 RepID=UPI00344A5B79